MIGEENVKFQRIRVSVSIVLISRRSLYSLEGAGAGAAEGSSIG